MDVANTCVYSPSLAIFLMYTLLMQLLTSAKLLLRLFASLLNTPRKMHKSKLSQNFYTIGRNNEAKNLSSDLTSKIIKTYYRNLTTDSDGLCNIQAKSGYTPIFAWVIYPTSSMQTYARIQYNPYSGQFFAKTPLISSGIELNVIYVKMELTH